MSDQPFAKLQMILDKQQTRPLRSSPLKKVQERSDVGLILNRKKFENQEAPIKRMYPEKVEAMGYTWADMMKRTSKEVIIGSKVNISEARAFFPDTKRCIQPEKNDEYQRQFVKKQGITEELKKKQENHNLIVGDSTSAIDKRVCNRRARQVGLINRFENNQGGWSNQTNNFVNRLKEEAQYNPEKDFIKDNSPINDRMAMKMEIMENQCKMHKENMKKNPITGDTSAREGKVSGGRRRSMLGQSMLRSEILPNHEISHKTGAIQTETNVTPSISHSQSQALRPRTPQPVPSSRMSRVHRDYHRETSMTSLRRSHREAYTRYRNGGNLAENMA